MHPLRHERQEAKVRLYVREGGKQARDGEWDQRLSLHCASHLIRRSSHASVQLLLPPLLLLLRRRQQRLSSPVICFSHALARLLCFSTCRAATDVTSSVAPATHHQRQRLQQRGCCSSCHMDCRFHSLASLISIWDQGTGDLCVSP